MQFDQLRRREFVTLLGGAAAWPLTARAQQPGMPVIGFLQRTGPIRSDFAHFRDGLAAAGYEQGRTIRIEQRYAGGNEERLHELVRELIGMNPAVMVVDGIVTVEAVQSRTMAVPIVSAIISDPARLRITNLNRPGGNVTGLSTLIDFLFAKRLELVKEMLPHARRVAVLRNAVNVSLIAEQVTRQAAAALGVELRIFELHTAGDWSALFAEIADARPDALLQFGDASFANRPREFVEFALARRLPAMYGEREFVTAGGLISYGVSLTDQWRRAASYVDKILKGSIPGDLPIEQPTKFELMINLKTAKALGIDVPVTLLARADEVIE
jgi:putative tryptophan/tyrosine transport system substrate-binding protein